MTHYDTLQLPPEASAAQIRDAYRRLARRHHPDRGGRDASAMAAINEAYHVLGDPARRVAYDATLRGPATSAAGGQPPRTAPAGAGRSSVRHLEELPPARYPWKLVIGLFVLGATIVLVGAALYEPGEEPPPDNLLGPGSCVAIEDNGDAREVHCDGTEDLVVEALVAMDDRCPTGTSGYRDRQGRGLACVTSVP